MLINRLSIHLAKTLGKLETRALVTRFSSGASESHRNVLDVIRDDTAMLHVLVREDYLSAPFDSNTYLGVDQTSGTTPLVSGELRLRCQLDGIQTYCWRRADKA